MMCAVSVTVEHGAIGSVAKQKVELRQGSGENQTATRGASCCSDGNP